MWTVWLFYYEIIFYRKIYIIIVYYFIRKLDIILNYI